MYEDGSQPMIPSLLAGRGNVIFIYFIKQQRGCRTRIKRVHEGFTPFVDFRFMINKGVRVILQTVNIDFYVQQEQELHRVEKRSLYYFLTLLSCSDVRLF